MAEIFKTYEIKNIEQVVDDFALRALPGCLLALSLPPDYSNYAKSQLNVGTLEGVMEGSLSQFLVLLGDQALYQLFESNLLFGPRFAQGEVHIDLFRAK